MKLPVGNNLDIRENIDLISVFCNDYRHALKMDGAFILKKTGYF